MSRLAFLTTLLGLLLSPALSPAATFPVTKAADTNDGLCNADCSLREAVIAANAAAGTDTVLLAPGTYALSLDGAAEDAAATGDLDLLSAGGVIEFRGTGGGPADTNTLSTVSRGTTVPAGGSVRITAPTSTAGSSVGATSEMTSPAWPTWNAAPARATPATSGTARSAGPSDTTKDAESAPVSSTPGPGSWLMTSPCGTVSLGTRSTVSLTSASSKVPVASARGFPTASGMATRLAPRLITTVTVLPSRTREPGAGSWPITVPRRPLRL